MELTTYQNFERRNAQDQIIRPGTWGKNTALVNGQNTGILDYIANNFDWLKINKAEAADVEALQGNVTSLQSAVTALDEGKVDKLQANSVGKALIVGNDNQVKASATATYIKRNTAYSVGDIAYSEKLGAGYYLECVQAGTTGATEPDWNSSGGV